MPVKPYTKSGMRDGTRGLRPKLDPHINAHLRDSQRPEILTDKSLGASQSPENQKAGAEVAISIVSSPKLVPRVGPIRTGRPRTENCPGTKSGASHPSGITRRMINPGFTSMRWLTMAFGWVCIIA